MVEDIIIRLLARMAFKKEDITQIVTFKKGKNATNYLKGYNACNGKTSVTELATIIGVDKANASRALTNWEEEGIIYEVEGQSDGKFYKKVMKIDKREDEKNEL